MLQMRPVQNAIDADKDEEKSNGVEVGGQPGQVSFTVQRHRVSFTLQNKEDFMAICMARLTRQFSLLHKATEVGNLKDRMTNSLEEISCMRLFSSNIHS
jgi:hypothetical protein